MAAEKSAFSVIFGSSTSFLKTTCMIGWETYLQSPNPTLVICLSVAADHAAARLAVGRALNEFGARIEQFSIVEGCRIDRVELQRCVERSARFREIAAQHIRVALVIENAGGLAVEIDRGGIGVVGQIKSPQSIVARRQTDPGGYVLRRFFDGVLEILLRQAEAAFVELLDAEFDGFVRTVVFDVARVLSRKRIGGRGGASAPSAGSRPARTRIARRPAEIPHGKRPGGRRFECP